MSKNVLPQDFYIRNPETVAQELLGNKLIRKFRDHYLAGIIVETEAYYGLEDPASRAYHGIKNYNKGMWEEPGRTFIYNVHKYWMFNVVAHLPKKIGAVLIRALEPVKGIPVMKKNRPVENLYNLTSGPGKLTIALNIDKSLNECSVTSPQSAVIISPHNMNFEMASSHRIGVKKDLDRHLRFYIRGNKFVSR